ncbi:MAG: hypothetical protein CMH63_01535 [Nanoarchaeota archaeon]|jgi:hypothetical protein|nr:hypothetical protein [Nanoarchaeota archaeon]|tara:strand:- start:85435 stop:86106 length:672 start_codon:yes stop_codon:yes gene_type:complete
MVLKFISRSLGGLCFSLAFLLLFIFIFGASMVENVDTFEADLKAQISNSNLILNQLAQSSGMTEEELKEICNQMPSQEGCDLINNPELALDQMGISSIKTEIQSYEQYVDMLVTPMLVLFVLSLVFYFVGMLSFYGAIFKISVNALLSGIVGYFAFTSIPSFIPKIMEKLTVEQEVPAELQAILTTSFQSWLEIPLTTLNSFFLGLIAVSLVIAIIFWFLKRK